MGTRVQQLEEDIVSAESDLDQIQAIFALLEEIHRSEPQRALALAEEAQDIARRSLERNSSSNDTQTTRELRRAIANSLLNQGICRNQLAEYGNATELLKQAFDLYESLKDFEGSAQSANNIGLVYKNLGDFPVAMEYYHRSIFLAEQIGFRRCLMGTLLNIGNVYFILGDYVRALEQYERSLLLNDEIGHTQTKGFQLSNIGSVFSQMGDYKQALEYFEQSLSIYENLSDIVGEAHVHLNIAATLKELNDLETATFHAEKGLAQSKKTGRKASLVLSLNVLGTVVAATKRHAEALELFREALAMSRAELYTQGEMTSLAEIGKVLGLIGETDEAVATLEQALALAETGQMKQEINQYHKLLSDVYERSGQHELSLRHYKLYHTIEREVVNEETTKKTMALQTWHASEQALKEAEIHRLKNVELLEANTKLQALNKEKSEFLGIAAHDLKNQLSSIILSAGIVEKHPEKFKPEELRRQMSQIGVTAEHMREIILNLLDVNLLETGKIDLALSSFNLGSLCVSVVKHYFQRAAEKGIEIIYEDQEEPICAWADNAFTQEVLENLLSNAIKFSPRGKRVWLDIARINNKVRICVKDEGPGLTKEDQRDLFGKFARLTAKPTAGEHSTGLGLWIVHKLVDVMKGRVWCESSPGNGAEFIVLLPAAREENCEP